METRSEYQQWQDEINGREPKAKLLPLIIAICVGFTTLVVPYTLIHLHHT